MGVNTSTTPIQLRIVAGAPAKCASSRVPSSTPGTPTGALVLAGAGRAGAGPAADARVALIQQRVVRDALVEQIAPDLSARPVGERIHLRERATVRQMMLDDFRVGARGTLVTSD